MAQATETGVEDGGETVDAFGDLAQAGGAVIYGVHRGHVGEERLGRADVAGGLFATDVLLARAEREAEAGAAARVLGDADEASGHLAFEGVACGHEGGVRSAVAERDAEALGAADGDIGSEFTGRAQEREREQVRGDDDERAGGVGAFGEGLVIAHGSVGGGILNQSAEDGRAEREFGGLAHDDFESEGMGAGANEFNRLRMTVSGDEENVAVLRFLDAMAHGHGLGGGSGFVEERGVGDLQAGEVADHRLEIEE